MFEEMQKMMSRGEDPWTPKGTPEKLLARLEKAEAEFNSPCPFKVGDLVTPRKEASSKGRGLPRRVLTVTREKQLVAGQDRGDAYSIMDMDVFIAFHDGNYRIFPANSTEYELWDPEILRASQKEGSEE